MKATLLGVGDLAASSTSSAVSIRTMLSGRLAGGPFDLLVAVVADHHDRVALGGEAAGGDVDLGDQRAGGVDRAQVAGGGVVVDRRGDAVGGEDDHLALRHLGLLLDEDRAALGQLLDHVLVVDDLLAHVDGGAVQLERALDRLHGAVDAGAVAARGGEQDALGSGGGGGCHDCRVAVARLRPRVRVARSPAKLALRDEHRRTPSRPPDRGRRLVPDQRELDQPHARRRDPDLRGAAAPLRRPGRARARPPAARCRASARSWSCRRWRPGGRSGPTTSTST